MKSPIVPLTFWLAFALLAVRTPAQDAASVPPVADNAPTAPAPVPVASSHGRGAATLRFNFRGAPLDTVLNYMSEAAGFVIVLDTPVHGTVDMFSAQPIDRDEAVQLLNFALNKNGYSATVRGRNLIISSKEEAKKKNIPIRTGSDPRDIPDDAEMVMQIIPLRRIDAQQAATDLATLFPPSATVTANADSNALLVTDTNSNIRHIVELVNSLDTSADTVTTMRVFKLKNADPMEMAQLLTSVYSPTTSGRAGTPGFGGFGGGTFPQSAMAAIAAAAGRRAGGGGGQSGGRNSSNRTRTGGTAASLATPVVAVADPRTYSVIVTASKEAMNDIAEVVAQLDGSSARKQHVYVYTMENADVNEVQTVLQNLFQSTTQRSTQSQIDPLTQRAQSNTQINSTNLSLGSNGR